MKICDPFDLLCVSRSVSTFYVHVCTSHFPDPFVEETALSPMNSLVPLWK